MHMCIDRAPDSGVTIGFLGAGELDWKQERVARIDMGIAVPSPLAPLFVVYVPDPHAKTLLTLVRL